MDKKEVKVLMYYVKKLDKKVYKKLKKLPLNDKKAAAEYIIKVKMHNMADQLKEVIGKMKKEKVDTFLFETRMHSFNNKVRLFLATYSKKDFDSMMKLRNKINLEMKHV